jgi:hypothetical protein
MPLRPICNSALESLSSQLTKPAADPSLDPGEGVPSSGWGRPKGNPVRLAARCGKPIPELPPQL